MKYSTSSTWAPKCAHPDCNTRVYYHERYAKEDGTIGYKWKSFCEHHRTSITGRAARELFIHSKGGCENRNGDIGLPWRCGDPSTSSLTIDHWDGNKYNNDESNIKVLCANCHNQKTKLFGDHQQRYHNANSRFDELFEEVK
jgi:hypothetical protein